MSFNQSGTFVYSPDVSVVIAKKDGTVVDVTQDIMNFSVGREIAQTSTFTCTLNNPKRKYNGTINTMDRITVFLKKIDSYIQCFTGYVTYAPIETLVPTPVTIHASCTLYLLQNTFWDDTLIDYQSLLLNYMDQTATSNQGTYNDGGIAQAVVNVLYDVVGWNPNAIHIQGIPPNFVQFAANAMSNVFSPDMKVNQQATAELSKLLGTSAVVSGNTSGISTTINNTTTMISLPGSQFSNNLVAPSDAPDGGVGVAINASQAKGFITTSIGNSKTNYPGNNQLNPVDIGSIQENLYYCSAPFSYLNLHGTSNQTKVKNAKSWLSKNITTNKSDGRLLLVANHKTKRVVAVRLTSIPQKIDTSYKGAGVYDPDVDYLQLHPGVVAYLNNDVVNPSDWSPFKLALNSTNTADIVMAWAGDTIHVGKQANLDSYPGIDGQEGANATAIETALQKLIYNLRGQIGDAYSKDQDKRKKPGGYGQHNGSFDCSGLAYWAYGTIGITLNGSVTTDECGPVTQDPTASYYWHAGTKKTDGTYQDHPHIYGAWIDNRTQPQPGDILFWQVPSDGGKTPQHATILSEAIGNNGIGKSIQANQPGKKLDETNFHWNAIRNGQRQGWGGRYIGARRPILLHPHWGTSANQNYSPPPVSNAASDNTNNTSFSLTNAYNTLFQAPNWNITASALNGSPAAFILDNSVMSDLVQILNSGLRTYQSAPNGDFIAWFPDYYGVYGTEPALDISPVEIIDFEIYHDDTQLVTHVGVIGDTTGIGSQVSNVDQMVTQGIVSIQDASTMQILFGQAITSNGVTTAATNFLNRYGIRPYVTSQTVIHTNALEYLYALQTFMEKWVEQFVCNVSLTFMPELYPGMRISMTLDNESGGTDSYQFYVTSVQHNGDRSNGFTTNATVTAPIKNGQIMNYGLDIAS